MFLYQIRQFLLMFSLLLPLVSWAQSQSVIPYSGTLYSQGQPISQSTPIMMGFALYSGSPTFDNAITTVPTNQATRLWVSWSGEQQDTVTRNIDVLVRNGRFLVNLGEIPMNENGEYVTTHRALPKDRFQSDGLHLVIWVEKANGDSFRLPPQKFNTVPYAITAQQAMDFEVKGDLTVDGSLSVSANQGGNSTFVRIRDVNPECNGQDPSSATLGVGVWGSQK